MTRPVPGAGRGRPAKPSAERATGRIIVSAYAADMIALDQLCALTGETDSACVRRLIAEGLRRAKKPASARSRAGL